MDDREYAERFALEHADYTEDLPFWRQTAARLGSPILDLGAASGRVALPLVRDGLDVCALDRSEAMLGELARRADAEPEAVRERLSLVRGDLRDFSLDRRFALVLVAMNTLQVLTDAEDRLACFRAVRDHLEPRGEFAFDVALPDVEEIEENLHVERQSGEYRDAETGVVVLQSAWYECFDAASSTLTFVIRVRDRTGPGAGAERRREHTVHLFSRREIGELLEAAGLRTVAVYGDFSGGRLTTRSERQVYRCVAAGAAA